MSDTLHVVAETGSTNADLIGLARAGAVEGTWLRAERQTAGRGRQGRAWASPGGNLYASTLVRLRPGDPPAATLALVAAVALHGTLHAHGLHDASLKWPNDVLVGSAKLAGILLERVADAVVIGIGVNVASQPDLPDRATTSLAMQGIAADPAVLLETLRDDMARWLRRWRGEGLPAIREAWLARAHPPGTALRAHDGNGAPLEGLFAGLAHDGALILRLADGTTHVMHAGDIHLLSPRE
ncbi:biotin--[acetyl-CoA-carboxylase] ligase [Sphingomonas baiyangensis]|uniref:biotin--[biotin carboxyl-carrier protein] ligase n=1 Tax=Sphingomonas baiyangensis TaxID=2572576 RepID=A0A4U1L6E6_9SPHN|nr:biotin--[acetyl-CoA-carboxylase] ligase [Sphingomonas baiyangensis]